MLSLGAGRAKRTIASLKRKTIDKRSLESFTSLRRQHVLNGGCVLADVSRYALREKGNRAKWCVHLTPPWLRYRSTLVERNANAVLIASPA